ncbi:MAG: ferrochelatase [Parachlamydiales bacterium]|jgi:protoheme ferro-lyase
MFSNKKIVYVFVTLGNESLKETSKSFFDKIFKKKQTAAPKKIINDIHPLSERLIFSIAKHTDNKCLSFYLNLENTHEDFLNLINEANAERYYIFPLFPQYCNQISFIANYFSINISDKIIDRFFWIKSYHHHHLFIKSIERSISNLMKKDNLDQKNTLFLFAASNSSKENSLYLFECENTSQKIIKSYPYVEGSLHYYPENLQTLDHLNDNHRKIIIIIPISTLINDEETQESLKSIKDYLENQKKNVFICNTLNESSFFIRSVLDIIEEKNYLTNKMLLTLS